MPPILLAICSLGAVRVEHEINFAAVREPMGKMCVNMAWIGLPIQEARNAAAHEAIVEGRDYLMFYDDDILPRSYDALRILHSTMDQNPHIDILGGVYPRRGTFPEPIVVKEYGEGVWWGWQDGGIHEVYVTGTGFTMFRVSSLNMLDCPTYTLPNGTTVKKFFELGHNSTDEFTFADKSNPAGLHWYVHGDIICDQIDIDGTRYRIEDAQIKAPLPKMRPRKKRKRRQG